MLKVLLKANNWAIGELKILNDGTGTEKRGNYRYEICDRVGEKTTIKTGNFKNYPREMGAWKLVCEILAKEF